MKAFIFTMDAVLAFIPIFIFLAAVSHIGGGESLMLQGFILGSERIAQDTLEVMDATGDIESLNRTEVNETLETLVSGHLDYTYEMEYNQSTIVNVTKGNITNARDVMIAKRASAVQIFNLSGEMLDISHFGSNITTPCYDEGSGKPRIYNVSFFVTSDELSTFDFWIRMEWVSGTATSWYDVAPKESENYCVTGKTPSNKIGPFNSPGDSDQETINGELTADTTNTVYVRVSGNGEANLFIIRAPKNIDESLITGENAKRKHLVTVTLKVWRGG